jgi:hypothetical protein
LQGFRHDKAALSRRRPRVRVPSLPLRSGPQRAARACTCRHARTERSVARHLFARTSSRRLSDASASSRRTSTRPTSSNLRDAFLGEANLRGANLFGVNPQHADLVGVNLQGADLVLANHEDAVLEEARHDASTRRREEFDADAAGARRVSRSIDRRGDAVEVLPGQLAQPLSPGARDACFDVGDNPAFLPVLDGETLVGGATDKAVAYRYPRRELGGDRLDFLPPRLNGRGQEDGSGSVLAVLWRFFAGVGEGRSRCAKDPRHPTEGQPCAPSSTLITPPFLSRRRAPRTRPASWPLGRPRAGRYIAHRAGAAGRWPLRSGSRSDGGPSPNLGLRGCGALDCLAVPAWSSGDPRRSSS